MPLTFTCVKETCIYVQDLAKAKRFYHDQLGLPIVSESKGRHVFFRVGNSMFLCFNAEATKKSKDLPPHFGSGQQHYAFEVKPNDYKDWKQKFQKETIQIEKEVDWKGKKSFYFRDPDGNLGEIVMAGIWGF